MFSHKNKNTIASMVVLLFGMCGLVEGAPRTYPAAICRPGLDGPCVPKRETYGYTPTTWRRWPSDSVAGTPKPASESLPTPANDPPPSREAEGPLLMPEEPSLAPTETTPTTPEPSAEPDFAPPFEDTPPEPPKELAPATEEALPEGLPEPPDDAQIPLDSAAPPIPPEDNPFKDDPPGENDSPTPEPNHGASRNRWNHGGGQQVAIPWHAAGKGQTIFAHGFPKPSSANEPQRLKAIESGADSQQAALPNQAPGNSNPLRTANFRTREDRVVPTASWSVEESLSNAEAIPMRRNPLRDH